MFYVTDVRFIKNSTNLFDIQISIFTQLRAEVVAAGKFVIAQLFRFTAFACMNVPKSFRKYIILNHVTITFHPYELHTSFPHALKPRCGNVIL